MALLKNQNPKGHEHPTVVFKRKQHRSEEGHHGGVWKIAYADFMTAMMTFFLVMWLINSASKEKITQLANYFNPVKLHDRVPGAKGAEAKIIMPGAKARIRRPISQAKTPPNPVQSLTRFPTRRKKRLCFLIRSARFPACLTSGSHHDGCDAGNEHG